MHSPAAEGWTAQYARFVALNSPLLQIGTTVRWYIEMLSLLTPSTGVLILSITPGTDITSCCLPIAVIMMVSSEAWQSRGKLLRCPIARLLKACGQLGVQPFKSDFQPASLGTVTTKILENWTLWASSGAAPNQQRRAELKLCLTALHFTVEGVAPSDPLGREVAYGPTGRCISTTVS